MLPLAADRLRVRLRLTRPARFHFHHGGVLRGLLSRALRSHALPAGLIPFASELGRVRFEPGDPYHLAVTLIGEDRRLAGPLVEGLRRAGADTRSRGGPPPTLGGNFEVESVEPLPLPDAESAATDLARGGELPLRFLSPLRLERPPELKAKGAGYLNQDCFPAGHFLARLWNRLFFVAHGRWPEADDRAAMPPLPAAAEAEPRGLLWLDVPVEGAPGKRRAYTLGGVLGTVALRGLTDDWLPILAAGRLVHAGADPSFGFGAYEIAAPGPLADHPLAPARPLLEAAASEAALERALDHVLADSVAAGVDGVTTEAFSDRRDPALAELAAEIAAGRYRPSALAGFLQRKDDGGVRPLAVPTVRDRAAQRAAGEALGPSIDVLLEDCSYAYRKGFSRAGAARALEVAYAEGYRWLLDADVAAFFDSVDHRRLFAKLEALWPLDPVVALLREWVRAPVVFDGRTIERDRGLPQGAAVSPLLANLFLDELDEEVLGAGYRLVRYADDFVVLAKDAEEARRAREVVRRALAGLGLRLADEKTAVRSFAGGFSYLGYLFVRSLVLEKERGGDEAAEAARPLAPDDVPAESWLAAVPFARVRALVAGKAARRRRRAVTVVPLGDGEPALAPARRPLYVSSHAARLRRDGGRLVVESGDGGGEASYPLESLSHLTFIGHSRATMPLLLSLAADRVPSFFCRRSGEVYAQLGPCDPDWSLWLEQARRAEDGELRLRFARELVAAKLHNQATLAVRFEWRGREAAAGELRELAAAAVNQGTVESLLGFEGRGAAVFFAALAENLPAEWGFSRRQRQPPPDPVNAMLSFGYTLLYNHATTALVVAGLNPRIGFFHQGRGRHDALASDLVEELRWLVDALVWSLVAQKRVAAGDFTESPDGRYPCWMTPGFRGRFIGYFEDRLHTAFTPADGERTTYRGHLAAQARRVGRLARGEAGVYRPLRLEA